MVFPGRPADVFWFCFAHFLDINKLLLGPELMEEAEFGKYAQKPWVVPSLCGHMENLRRKYFNACIP